MNLTLKTVPKAITGLFKQNEITIDELCIFSDLLKRYYQNISEVKDQSEEHYKSILREFLKNTFYQENYVNTKSFNGLHEADLVIHESNQKSPVHILFEIKNPNNSTEMITPDNMNKKAIHEAVLYYLQERINNNNKLLKYIIITNCHNFYIFDAKDFKKYFYDNAVIRNLFNDWNAHRTDDDTTNSMYTTIKDEIKKSDLEISAIHFNIDDYCKFSNKANNAKVKQLYQIFSPRFMMKETPKQDSNELNREFYNELLYIMGLEEYNEKNKKLIRRCEKPNPGSLLESTISKLHSRHLQNPERFGKSTAAQEFNFSLQLGISWINRILFLKLLEAQLVSYHNYNPKYHFLNSKRVKNYNELSELFFEVLAIQEKDRDKHIKEKWLL